MTTSTDPEEIRADIERTRASLSDNVDRLTESAAPSNVAKRQVDKVKDAAGSVKDRVMGVASDVGDRAGERAYSAGDSLTSAKDSVAAAPQRAKTKTQGNPLAAGLIAFGAGLLVSGLIPSSQKEQRAVSALQEKAEPLKAEAVAVVKESAETLREPAQDAAQSVKTTAQEGAERVKDEGAAAKDEVRDQVSTSKDNVAST